MLVRNGRLLETTLLVSRQTLTRAAASSSRPYSSPSSRRDAPASALAHSPSPADDLPPFAGPPPPKSAVSADLEVFLKRGVPRTILPQMRPNPMKAGSSGDGTDNFWLVDTSTQDLLGIINACLHSLYDVRRAMGVFDKMRQQLGGNQILETRIYNSFLEAYLGMVTKEHKPQRQFWLDNAWELFEQMESGKNSPPPTESTYALMIQIWYR